MLVKFESASLFLWLGVQSTLIRHENGTLRRRSTNRTNLTSTLALHYLKMTNFPFNSGIYLQYGQLHVWKHKNKSFQINFKKADKAMFVLDKYIDPRIDRNSAEG